MILVDTTVWVDHLRHGDEGLAALLNETSVLAHPHIIGELACGSVQNRREILGLLQKLPSAPLASDSEALIFIEANNLAGRGIGYIDVHLLAATALTGDALLWTRDKKLAAAADQLGLGYEMSS